MVMLSRWTHADDPALSELAVIGYQAESAGISNDGFPSLPRAVDHVITIVMVDEALDDDSCAGPEFPQPDTLPSN